MLTKTELDSMYYNLYNNVTSYKFIDHLGSTINETIRIRQLSVFGYSIEGLIYKEMISNIYSYE